MGNDESHFNGSLIGRDKVTRQCPETKIFEEKGEPKRIRTAVPLLTSLSARPNRLTTHAPVVIATEMASDVLFLDQESPLFYQQCNARDVQTERTADDNSLRPYTVLHARTHTHSHTHTHVSNV